MSALTRRSRKKNKRKTTKKKGGLNTKWSNRYRTLKEWFPILKFGQTKRDYIDQNNFEQTKKKNNIKENLFNITLTNSINYIQTQIKDSNLKKQCEICNRILNILFSINDTEDKGTMQVSKSVFDFLREVFDNNLLDIVISENRNSKLKDLETNDCDDSLNPRKKPDSYYYIVLSVIVECLITKNAVMFSNVLIGFTLNGYDTEVMEFINMKFYEIYKRKFHQ